MDTAPKASGCFLGGTQEIFGAVSEDFLGGAGKAEDAKLPGAGIIPKLCVMLLPSFLAQPCRRQMRASLDRAQQAREGAEQRQAF